MKKLPHAPALVLVHATWPASPFHNFVSLLPCNKLPHCKVVVACTKFTQVINSALRHLPLVFGHLVCLFSLTARSSSYYRLHVPFSPHQFQLLLSPWTPQSLRVLINYHNKSINNHITTNFFTVTPKEATTVNL